MYAEQLKKQKAAIIINYTIGIVAGILFWYLLFGLKGFEDSFTKDHWLVIITTVFLFFAFLIELFVIRSLFKIGRLNAQQLNKIYSAFTLTLTEDENFINNYRELVESDPYKRILDGRVENFKKRHPLIPEEESRRIQGIQDIIYNVEFVSLEEIEKELEYIQTKIEKINISFRKIPVEISPILPHIMLLSWIKLIIRYKSLISYTLYNYKFGDLTEHGYMTWLQGIIMDYEKELNIILIENAPVIDPSLFIEEILNYKSIYNYGLLDLLLEKT